MHVEQLNEVSEHVQITQVDPVNLRNHSVVRVQVELLREKLSVVAESDVKNVVYHVSHCKYQNIRVLVFRVVQANK